MLFPLASLLVGGQLHGFGFLLFVKASMKMPPLLKGGVHLCDGLLLIQLSEMTDDEI
jgi:hypothetical protein